jgi:hypothetical protein
MCLEEARPHPDIKIDVTEVMHHFDEINRRQVRGRSPLNGVAEQ